MKTLQSWNNEITTIIIREAHVNIGIIGECYTNLYVCMYL